MARNRLRVKYAARCLLGRVTLKDLENCSLHDDSCVIKLRDEELARQSTKHYLGGLETAKHPDKALLES